MLSEERALKPELHKTFIEKIETLGFSDIKADFEGYEMPKTYKSARTQEELVPDITGMKGNTQYIFEMGIKTSNAQDLKTKWSFLKTISDMKGYKFEILTMKGHLKFVDTMVKELDIEVKTTRI